MEEATSMLRTWLEKLETQEVSVTVESKKRSIERKLTATTRHGRAVALLVCTTDPSPWTGSLKKPVHIRLEIGDSESPFEAYAVGSSRRSTWQIAYGEGHLAAVLLPNLANRRIPVEAIEHLTELSTELLSVTTLTARQRLCDLCREADESLEPSTRIRRLWQVAADPAREASLLVLAGGILGNIGGMAVLVALPFMPFWAVQHARRTALPKDDLGPLIPDIEKTLNADEKLDHVESRHRGNGGLFVVDRSVESALAGQDVVLRLDFFRMTIPKRSDLRSWIVPQGWVLLSLEAADDVVLKLEPPWLSMLDEGRYGLWLEGDDSLRKTIGAALSSLDASTVPSVESTPYR